MSEIDTVLAGLEKQFETYSEKSIMEKLVLFPTILDDIRKCEGILEKYKMMIDQPCDVVTDVDENTVKSIMEQMDNYKLIIDKLSENNSVDNPESGIKIDDMIEIYRNIMKNIKVINDYFAKQSMEITYV